MLPNSSLSFITNNVKGIQDKIGSTGVLFLQETHSDSKVEQNGKKTLKVQIFFLTES